MRILMAGALLAAALGLGGCVTHSRANYERVKVGMTRAQAEEIVGKPWGHDGNKAKYWGFDGDFEIKYDEHGFVKEKDWD